MHRLQGASATVGATRLRDTCARIVTSSDEELRGTGAHLLSTIEEEANTAIAALVGVIENL